MLVPTYVETVEYTPETAIKEVFGENSVMYRIAQCESNLTHFTASGEVLKGYTGDIGLFQIAPQYWSKEAERLNYDIYTIMGNALMAKHILSVQGIGAWNPSRHCWGGFLTE